MSQLFKPQYLSLGLFALVFGLELTTSPNHIFSYLYVGVTIVLSTKLNENQIKSLTLALGILTIFHGIEWQRMTIEPVTLINRSIVVIALAISAWLSIENRHYLETIALQKLELDTQQQLSNLREEFIASLTHDLKTPLLGAIEALNSCQEGTFGLLTNKQHQLVTILQRSHQTSLDLLQTLVDIYRNDRDGLHLADSKVNLQQLTIEVVEMLQPIAQNRQIEIGLIYDLAKSSDSWMIRGDALQLKRVLINFISNAINHSLRGTEVTVELERTEQDTIVKVGDRGNGIDPVDLPHLFDRFYQGRKQRYGKGIGLGLYLSKQIITAHNGTIWAETRPTQGAILAFKLPNH